MDFNLYDTVNCPDPDPLYAVRDLMDESHAYRPSSPAMEPDPLGPTPPMRVEVEPVRVDPVSEPPRSDSPIIVYEVTRPVQRVGASPRAQVGVLSAYS